MKRRSSTVLAPRKTAVGRADMLWLVHSLGESQAALVAPLGGFQWVGRGDNEPRPTPPPPPARPPLSPSPPTTRPPLRATHFAVIRRHSIPEADVGVDEPVEADSRVFESFDGTGESPPPPIPLSPQRRLAVFLGQTLRARRAGKDPDIPCLLGYLARASLPRHLPKAALRRWGPEAALVIDLSLPAFPLNDDLIDLAEQAHALSAGRLIVLCSQPGQGWLQRQPGPHGGWKAASEGKLLAARHWLLAGDLGSLSSDDATRHAWDRRLRAHLSAGGQATLLTGCGGDAWKARLPRQSRWATWDHGRRLVPARPGGVPAALGAASHRAGVGRLLAALALAVRIEPPLLRELRLLLELPIACELAVWNHPDVDRCILGMQIRPDRLADHRARTAELPLALRRQIVERVRRRHLGLSQLIRMEEAALAADLAEWKVADASAQWAIALNTLRHAADGAAARDLSAYLVRTGRRAHERLWRSVPALSDAYVVARRNELRAGAEVPAGLPVSRLNRHLAQAAEPDPHQGPQPMRVVQTGSDLVAQSQASVPGQFALLESPPTDGFELESPTTGRQWRPLSLDPVRLGALVPGAGPWTIRTPWVEAVVAEMPRPAWALEWGRDRRGLYALAPSPLGEPVKLHWFDGEDALGPGDWPPSPRGFRAAAVPLGHGMSLGADLRYGLYLDVPFGNEIQRFRWMEPGEFWMGSPGDERQRSEDEGPRHVVRLTRGFWLAETACTQALWRAVMGENPSQFKDDPQNPVERVNWDDAQEFLSRVERQLSGVGAVLPTEAEWEYACRAGTDMPFNFGEHISPEQANYDGGEAYAGGPTGEYRERTVPVKRFEPNGWGLYQMHGNVWEWCADGMRPYDGAAQSDPRGPEGDDEAVRVVRGGSWIDGPGGLRSAFRRQWPRGYRNYYQGVRFSLRSMGPEGGAERPPEVGAAPEGSQGEALAPGRRQGRGSAEPSARRDRLKSLAGREESPSRAPSKPKRKK